MMVDRLEIGTAVGPASIEYQVWGRGRPEVVMLHDGLGSIAQWRDTPAALAERLGVAVLAYNRPGHGGSTPRPDGSWPTMWLHHQADLLAGLVDLLGISDPLLVGHSDGGSISLVHASSGAPCRAVVALAPHSFVESVCVSAISDMRSNRGRIVAALAPYHRDAEALFEAWSGVWISEDFGRWDIRAGLSAMSCPTVVLQGDEDAYATDDQLRSTVEAIGSRAEGELLPGFGHLIHHQNSDIVVDRVARVFARAGQG